MNWFVHEWGVYIYVIIENNCDLWSKGKYDRSWSHVGKYDRADDRPKLAMLAIDIEPMIDRGLDDNCGPILACYIGPKIAPDDRPTITARVKLTIFQIYNDINSDNKI